MNGIGAGGGGGGAEEEEAEEEEVIRGGIADGSAISNRSIESYPRRTHG